MITRADAIFDDGPLRPLEQFEVEEQERIDAIMANLDDQFQREFGTCSVKLRDACGPLPWAGFLDLSTV